MTQEEKSILLKDLCTRLPYGVILHDEYRKKDYELKSLDANGFINYDLANSITHIKPYLRPMSSMTEEEKKQFDEVIKSCNNKVFACPKQERRYIFFDAEQEDFMNAHHFDYRGLIPMGLALEAPEDMYK